jgi:hypothetical protein
LLGVASDEIRDAMRTSIGRSLRVIGARCSQERLCNATIQHLECRASRQKIALDGTANGERMRVLLEYNSRAAEPNATLTVTSDSATNDLPAPPISKRKNEESASLAFLKCRAQICGIGAPSHRFHSAFSAPLARRFEGRHGSGRWLIARFRLGKDASQRSRLRP